MKEKRLGLGILSWHGYETLEASLKTYPEDGFLDFFDERVIYFPEISDRGRELAQKFGFQAKGQANNQGILAGFKGLATSLTSQTIVMLENDCPLIEAPQTARSQLSHAQHLIEDKAATVIRLRSTRDPGEAFDTSTKYRKMYPAASASLTKRYLAVCHRIIRPGKAHKLIGTAPYVENNPEQRFPNVLEPAGHGFFLAPTSAVTWTNQSIMIDRQFFLDVIIARAEKVKGRRTINGFKNLEIEMNDSWWRTQPWKVAIAPGLFTHRRLGSRGY